IIGDVFRPAVLRIVPVPGRKIDPELQTIFPGSLASGLDDVAFIRAVLNGMLGICTRPKTKPIVVFRGDDHLLKTGLLQQRSCSLRDGARTKQAADKS